MVQNPCTSASSKLIWIKSIVAFLSYDAKVQRRLFMKRFNAMILAVSCIVIAPAFAQTAGNTANTGPQGSGNFVAGKPEGTGTSFVAGKPEGEGTSFVKGKKAKGKKENAGDMTPAKTR
jgi:hypothetical protein